mgnify:CR=1 FL=1
MFATIPIPSRPTSSRGRHLPTGIARVRLVKWVGPRAPAWLTNPPNPLLFPGTVGVDRGEGEPRQPRKAAIHRSNRYLRSKRRQGWKKQESGKLEGPQGQAVPPVKAELAVGSVQCAAHAAHAGRSDCSLPHEACLGLPPEESATLHRFLRSSPGVPSPCSRPPALHPRLFLSRTTGTNLRPRGLFMNRTASRGSRTTRPGPGTTLARIQGASKEPPTRGTRRPASKASKVALLAPNHATPPHTGRSRTPLPLARSHAQQPRRPGRWTPVPATNPASPTPSAAQAPSPSPPSSPNTPHPHPHSTRKTTSPSPHPIPQGFHPSTHPSHSIPTKLLKISVA